MTREEAKCIIQDMLDDAEKYGDVDCDDLNDFISASKVAIEALKAERWIPCSESLPAYGEDVLIAIGEFCNVGHVVPTNDAVQYNWYFSGWYHSPTAVDAWMPLPSPYKAESEDKE